MDDEEYYGGQLQGYSIQNQPTVDPQDTIVAGGSRLAVGLTIETDQHEDPTPSYATGYLCGNTATYFVGHEGIAAAEHVSQAMADVTSPNIWPVQEMGYPGTPFLSAEYGPHTVEDETQTASAHIGNQSSIEIPISYPSAENDFLSTIVTDQSSSSSPSPPSSPLSSHIEPGGDIVCTEGKCAQNPQRFRRPGDYNMHTKRHRLPYKCTFAGCRWGQRGKGFSQRRELEKHEKTHLAGLSFSCPVKSCSSSATREDNLVRHLKKTHGIKAKKADIASLYRR
ncbi:predicted protein [Chaetomium globosum CBS 148.51]|uniref:C2H2 type master regulator of conidiophore development brlA n=1 Tax=Chaetomium globosum (strain ATCC 6205 / CBS 148.51 / DSM 1962 / NBRC 6347 / NRRL 1970) TaxID=306901 RepID=Q2H851_CHAGB|nr:uncharacterized protein CHGG_03603 [Chaetomium globosum CBS 148.51]EAQ91668.1 predicted protein [Chaetomium globosum CBS 148.51]